MSGFFDNWEPVDTSQEPTASTSPSSKEELPSTADQVEVIEAFTGKGGIPVEALEDSVPVVDDGEWDEGRLASGFSLDEREEITKTVFENVAPPSEVFEVAKAAGSGEWSLPQSANPAWKLVAKATNAELRDFNFVFAGIDGPRKAGKTGMVLDSLTDEEIANGAQIWHVDFDLGGETTKMAHHKDKAANIVVLNPWVVFKARSRVPFDFPATFQNTMDILLYAVEVAEAQEAYFLEHGKMPNPYLKTLCFDGLDHWLNICETVMKIEDLELGVDGIAVSGKAATTKIGRFNWNIRKNRYNAAMSNMLELARRFVHVYCITGRKPSYDKNGNEIRGADVPAWLKDSERDFQQLISVDIEEIRDDFGALTGEAVATAVLKANRTSLRAPEPVVLFQRNAQGGIWNGWRGLRDGSFHHAEDVHEKVFIDENGQLQIHKEE